MSGAIQLPPNTVVAGIVQGVGPRLIPYSPAVGGYVVGQAGPAGTQYVSYKLAWAEDFIGNLDLYSPNNPTGKFVPVKINPQNQPRSSPRSFGGYPSYLVDPSHTGANDANQGVPPQSWQDILTQSNSQLHMKCRKALTSERAMAEQAEYQLGTYISSVAACNASPPFLLEASFRTNPVNSLVGALPHFSACWCLMLGPMSKGNQQEIDFDHDDTNLSMFPTGYTVTDPGVPYGPITTQAVGRGDSTLTPNLDDGRFHLYGLEIFPDHINYWVDGVLIYTLTINIAAYGGRAYHWIANNNNNATASSLNFWGVNANFNRIDVDFVRFWIPLANTHRVSLTSQPAPHLVDYGSPLVMLLPTTAAEWGDGSVLDTVELMPYDVRAPGGNSQGMFWGQNFPPTITYSGGVVQSNANLNPGAGLIVRCGTHGGDSCVPKRYAFNVGPRIFNPGYFNCTLNSAMQTWNFYRDVDFGNLLPGVISLTTPPAGLTVNANTYTVTGTPTASGTMTMTATNSVGQKVTQSIAVGPSTPGSGSPCPITRGLIWSGNFDNTASITLASGSIGANGIISAIAGVDGTSAISAVQTTAARPTSVTINNRYWARFTGASSQYLDLGTALLAAFPTLGESQFSMWVVYKMVTHAANNVLLSMGLGAQALTAYQARLMYNSASTPLFHIGGSATTDISSTKLPAAIFGTEPHLLGGNVQPLDSNNAAGQQMIVDRNALYGYIAGSVPGIVSGTPTPLDNVLIGATTATSTVQLFADADIAWVGIYNVGLEYPEMNALAAWAAATWGTP